MNRIRPLLRLLLGFGLLAGCRSPLQTEYGSLRVSFGFQDGAKTLLPDFDMEPDSYVVAGDGPGDGGVRGDHRDQPGDYPGAGVRDWTVRVYARNAERIVIGQGSGDAYVHMACTATVEVRVHPLEGTGSLDLRVEWNEEDTDVPAIVAELIPASLPVMPLDFTVTGRQPGDVLPATESPPATTP